MIVLDTNHKKYKKLEALCWEVDQLGAVVIYRVDTGDPEVDGLWAKHYKETNYTKVRRVETDHCWDYEIDDLEEN